MGKQGLHFFSLFLIAAAVSAPLSAEAPLVDHDGPATAIVPSPAGRPLRPIAIPKVEVAPGAETAPAPLAPASAPTPVHLPSLVEKIPDNLAKWIGMRQDWLDKFRTNFVRPSPSSSSSPLPYVRVRGTTSESLSGFATPALRGIAAASADPTGGGTSVAPGAGTEMPQTKSGEDAPKPGYRPIHIPPEFPDFIPTPTMPAPPEFPPLPPDFHGTPGLRPDGDLPNVRPPSDGSGHGDDETPRSGPYEGDEISGRPPAARRYRISDDEFRIHDCGSPLLDQRDSNRCLQFASTSIMEHMLNKRADGTCSDKVNLSEWDMIKHARGSDSRFNEFTDQPFAFADALQNRLTIPSFDRDVLFSCGYDGAGRWDPWAVGGMTDEQIEDMKYALKTYDAPLLFVYKPQGVKWWHANVCIGFNKDGFICRDSAFGDDPYYDKPSKRGQYRDLYVLPYELARKSGKHASVYYKTSEAPPKEERVKQTRCAKR